MMSKPVLTENNNGILTLTINRPEKKNALTDEMYNLLYQGFVTASTDETVRVVFLKGSHTDFTGGNDLNDFVKWKEYVNNLEKLPVIQLMHQIIMLEKPLVVAVKGVAVGFGTTLLFHCDVVLAGESAKFSLPFSRLGVVPEFGCSYLFPKTSGRVRATHMMMLGDTFNAQTAYDLGIVSQLCTDETVYEQGLTRCQQLVQLPAYSLHQIKQMIMPPKKREKLLTIIAEETRIFAESLQSPEHVEAISAFFEKRKPNFNQFSYEYR